MASGKRLKILFFAPAGEYGGAGSLLRLLEPGRDHFDPIVVCPDKTFLTGELEKLGISYRPFETHKHKLSKRPDWHLWMIVSLAWHMRRNKVDVAVVNHGGNFPIIAYAARLARVPLIRYVRRTLAQNNATDFRDLEKKLLRKCAGLIFISKFIENEVREKLEDRLPKWVQIYNPQPIPDMSGKDSPAEVRKRFGVAEGAPVIGVFGSIYEAKGQDILVEAIAKVVGDVPKLRVLLVGDTLNEPFLAKVKGRIRELQLEDHFIFTGFQDEVLDIMQACDFSILPSRSEALGRVVIESWSVKRFVIGSAVDGMREIIEEADAGYLFENENVDDLAVQIREATARPDHCQEAAERGYRWVSESCDPPRYAARFTEFIREAIGGS